MASWDQQGVRSESGRPVASQRVAGQRRSGARTREAWKAESVGRQRASAPEANQVHGLSHSPYPLRAYALPASPTAQIYPRRSLKSKGPGALARAQHDGDGPQADDEIFCLTFWCRKAIVPLRRIVFGGRYGGVREDTRNTGFSRWGDGHTWIGVAVRRSGRDASRRASAHPTDPPVSATRLCVAKVL